MKIKTSDLTGAALDWAVALAANQEVWLAPGNFYPHLLRVGGQVSKNYIPSTNWAQGGPIIERERMDVAYDEEPGFPHWEAWIDPDIEVFPVGYMEFGDTPLIAAMRCYVGSKLGDEVEVPDALLA